MQKIKRIELLNHEGPIYIDLALQGGGAHGAFTWGVLDRLLEEPKLIIEGISGTSAGSLNAAVLASGYVNGGVTGAREALRSFWYSVSQAALFSPFQRGIMDMLSGQWTMDFSPAFLAFDLASRLLSPYDMNPVSLNPLRTILMNIIDFKAFNKTPIKLFITATNVRTGRGRVFRNREITPDVLLASGCLPTLFQAVEIEGEPYWDGGYSGNPTITPLIKECEASDTILVQINPIERSGTPRTARAILNRLNEVAFNATLMKELRMIAVLRQAVGTTSTGEGARWAQMRLHRIASDKMSDLSYSSKLNAEWAFLCYLKEQGRISAELFLREHGNDLNKRSSFDVDALLDWQ